MSVAAMVFAILGIVLFWIPWVGVLGVLFGLIGLVLGIAAMVGAKGNKGLGIVGIVLGAIALIGGLIIQIPSFYLADKGIDAIQKEMDKSPPDAPTAPPFQQKP
jgi:hypothetical protein